MTLDAWVANEEGDVEAVLLSLIDFGTAFLRRYRTPPIALLEWDSEDACPLKMGFFWADVADRDFV